MTRSTARAGLCIAVADAHGNAAAGGGDDVVVSVDSAAEGAAAVPVEARPPSHSGRLCTLEHACILRGLGTYASWLAGLHVQKSPGDSAQPHVGLALECQRCPC